MIFVMDGNTVIDPHLEQVLQWHRERHQGQRRKRNTTWKASLDKMMIFYAFVIRTNKTNETFAKQLRGFSTTATFSTSRHRSVGLVCRTWK